MKLTGELKDKVDQTANLEEAKDVIAKAGMLLTDDEVSEVAGGNAIASLGDLGNKLSAISQSTDVVVGKGPEVPQMRGPRS